MKNGISKGITREIIMNTTLELIKDKKNIRDVNLREIARTIGCAHTNLYNHFTDLDEILWICLDEVIKRSYQYILNCIGKADNVKNKLEAFYKSMVQFYLENEGWTRLFWVEKLKGEMEEHKMKFISETVDNYELILITLLQESFNIKITKSKAKEVFHTVHCYMYGEVSIFISGRGLIVEEHKFIDFVTNHCVQLTQLLLTK